MSYLLDTNVISELRKGSRCDASVGAWYAEVEAGDLFLSVVTLGELRKGVELIRRRDPLAADRLETWLLGLPSAYADRILGIDERIADRWGRLNAPDPLPVTDGLIAATAIVHGLTVVTRNVPDVARSGVAYLNPFTGERSG